jgi:hypothetical protein
MRVQGNAHSFVLVAEAAKNKGSLKPSAPVPTYPSPEEHFNPPAAQDS